MAVTACKKEKLDGDRSILTGTWNWTETYLVNNYCSPDSLWNYQLAASAYPDNNYSLEFQERGKSFFTITMIFSGMRGLSSNQKM